MTTLKRHFHPEFFMQALLYILMVSSYLLGFFFEGAFFVALIFQFFVGLFQVLSGFLHMLAYRSLIHARYLARVLLFFITMGLVFFTLEQVGASTRFQEFNGLLFVILIPIGIATWYLHMLTWYYGGKYQKLGASTSQEDLLDDLQIET